MAITQITPETVKRIHSLMEEYNDLLGNEFIKRVKRDLEAFEGQDNQGGMRKTSDENLKVAVVGAFSCGKSTFINSILNDQVAPVEITPKTHGVTSFLYGEKETYDADGKSITREQYQEQVQDGDNQVKHFLVQYPCERPKNLEFMDSPGFGSVSGKAEEVAKKDTALSQEAVNRADVVFFLTNITEGVIQGDALERLTQICNQKEDVINPHRRIYVILTWADAKSPSERSTVQKSIQKLVNEHQLPIQGVLLYSSLPLEKFRSASQKEYFSEARENLFNVLLDLQKFRVELIAFRQKLKSHFDQIKVQRFQHSFFPAIRSIIDSAREIKEHDLQRGLLNDWNAFREEAAECIYKVFLKKLGDNEYSLIYNEEEHFFSKSKIEVLCQKDLASLSAEELKSITAEIIRAGTNHGFTITSNSKSPFGLFFNPNSTKKEAFKEIENVHNAYKCLHESLFGYNWSELEIFPQGSLRDSFVKIVVEMSLSLGGPWYVDGVEEKARAKRQALMNIYNSEAKDHFLELIDSEMKNKLFNAKVEELMKKETQRLEALSEAVDAIENAAEETPEVPVQAPAAATSCQTCDVILTSTGTKTLKIARVIVQITGKNLEELLEELEEPPVTLQENAPVQQGQELKEKLEELGAGIELKMHATPVVKPPASYRIILTDIGKSPLKVARQVVQLTERKLDEVLEAFEEEAPYSLDISFPEDKATELKEQLEALGAKVELEADIQEADIVTDIKDSNISNKLVTYTLSLLSVGSKSLQVAKFLSEITEQDLEELLEKIEDLPYTLETSFSEEKAKELKKQLETLGCEVGILATETSATSDNNIPVEDDSSEFNVILPQAVSILDIIDTSKYDVILAEVNERKTKWSFSDTKTTRVEAVVTAKVKMNNRYIFKAQTEDGRTLTAFVKEADWNAARIAVPNARSKVIKVVRTITGLDAKEAKELVKRCPRPVKTGVSRVEAEAIKKQLEEAGAIVKLQKN